jgi:hypothetical protein
MGSRCRLGEPAAPEPAGGISERSKRGHAQPEHLLAHPAQILEDQLHGRLYQVLRLAAWRNPPETDRLGDRSHRGNLEPDQFLANLVPERDQPIAHRQPIF